MIMKLLSRRSALLVAGVALLAAGCAPGDTEPTSPGSTGTGTTGTGTAPSSAPSQSAGTATSGATEQGTVIEIVLSGDTVTPNAEKREAKVGDVITLNITSDHDDEIHMHGLDIEIPVKAGVPTSETITLSEPGSFEIESHHPAKTILILNVR
ncbi:hypothetical protein ACQBAU_11585 [Propionibacteriaceae bacterium Y2011]|uniref:hypothetical protein n=1 Tax=Microlunatus sp. Y2014 TaxID=3418488 RepID=UPI003B463289